MWINGNGSSTDSQCSKNQDLLGILLTRWTTDASSEILPLSVLCHPMGHFCWYVLLHFHNPTTHDPALQYMLIFSLI